MTMPSPTVTDGRITPEQAGTLPGLLRERVARTPQATAYLAYEPASEAFEPQSWATVAAAVGRWRAALAAEGLAPGDRVAIMLRNSPEWVYADLAAMAEGLITVPLYLDDRPDNIAFIINQTQSRVLFIEGRLQYQRLSGVLGDLSTLTRIVSIHDLTADWRHRDLRHTSLDDWLGLGVRTPTDPEITPDALASIVFTSGTTGRPKGVMLSHRNLLENAYASSRCAEVRADDLLLSFLPLSHTLERTAGYYLPMLAGAQVAFARSIAQLSQDLALVRPTVLISVPRIYEQVRGRIQESLASRSRLARWLFHQAVETGWHRFERSQGRARWHPRLLAWPVLRARVATPILERLGGRMRIAVCGGAPLPPDVARLFVGLGLTILHGYGLTEASPVVAVNRPEANKPRSIGHQLSNVDVRIGEQRELQVRGPSVMLGYWNNPQATTQILDPDGWLHTGDQAEIDDEGFIYITGRIKEIIVLANGEKVPPADMEMAIGADPLFEQIMVVGEGRPFLIAIAVLGPDQRARLQQAGSANAPALRAQLEREVIGRLATRLKQFPGYARVRRVIISDEPWTVENGLLTPTLKLKRRMIERMYAERIESLYASHPGVAGRARRSATG